MTAQRVTADGVVVVVDRATAYRLAAIISRAVRRSDTPAAYPELVELVADEAEAQVVARVRELRAAGFSYREVCDALDAEGTRPRRATRWAPSVVRRIALRS